MLEIIVELLLEFLVTIVGEFFVGVISHARSRFPWADRTVNTLLTAVMYFGVGLFAGWVSLWFFPEAFVRSETLHGISLVITPVLAGLTMALIGWLRVRQGKLAVRIETFSYGFLLAFGMALIRFLFTQ